MLEFFKKTDRDTGNRVWNYPKIVVVCGATAIVVVGVVFNVGKALFGG